MQKTRLRLLKPTVRDFVKKIADPVNAQQGNKLPVSTFIGIEDGTFEQGTARYEKRTIAINVPQWIPENCIQCNQCSLVCPHATIRPFLLTDEEAAAAPEGFVVKDATGPQLKGLKFRIQVSPRDCAGCGVCVQTCPAKEKALVMKPVDEMVEKNPLTGLCIQFGNQRQSDG